MQLIWKCYIYLGNFNTPCAVCVRRITTLMHNTTWYKRNIPDIFRIHRCINCE